MTRNLPKVETDTAILDYWHLTGAPSLTIGDDPIEVFPGVNSLPTPPDGVVGILVKSAQKQVNFDIVDSSSGVTLAYIVIWPSGNARGRSVGPFGFEPRCLPLAIAGSYDKEFIEQAAAARTPVRFISPASFTPDVPADTLIGTITGELPDEVLFIAHLDSIYSSPGANDNAASVIAMLQIAQAAATTGHRPRHTLRFIVSAGEEIGSIGMIHYAETRKKNGTFDRIKRSFNFDSVSWGPNIHIQTHTSGVRDIFTTIDRDLRIPGRVQAIDGDGSIIDNCPFKKTTIETIYVGSSGSDNNPYCWHRPNDIVANVPKESVEITFRLFREYLRREEGI